MTHEVFLPTTPGGENSNTPAVKVNQENPIGKVENSLINSPAKSTLIGLRLKANTLFVASRFRGRRSRHGAQPKVHSRFANGVH